MCSPFFFCHKSVLITVFYYLCKLYLTRWVPLRSQDLFLISCLGKTKKHLLHLKTQTPWVTAVHIFIRCASSCFSVQGEYGGGQQMKTSSTLHFFNITLEDDGIYSCVTHNLLFNISKKSKPAKLTVQGEHEFFLTAAHLLNTPTTKKIHIL